MLQFDESFWVLSQVSTEEEVNFVIKQLNYLLTINIRLLLSTIRIMGY